MNVSPNLPSQVRGFLELTGLRVPIVQAPIGSAATPELASSVARAGAMGALGLSWASPSEARSLVERTQDLADGGSFLANFVLHFPCGGMDAAVEAGVKAVTYSWGIDKDRIARAHAGGAVVGVQIGSPAGARLAREAGADFLIAQGIEAGGHVQSTTPLAMLLPTVLAEARHLPVLAAGGIANGAAIARSIEAGAAGAMLGTRFVATTEAGTHADYKQRLVEASGEGTVFTNCFDIDWPYAMHRVLRNDTFEAWEAAGCPQAPNRPGEGEVVMQVAGRDFVRYCDTPPPPCATGALGSACLYAGKGVGDIASVMPAGDLVRALWTDATAALAATAGQGGNL